MVNTCSRPFHPYFTAFQNDLNFSTAFTKSDNGITYHLYLEYINEVERYFCYTRDGEKRATMAG